MYVWLHTSGEISRESQAPFYFYFSCELMETNYIEWKLTKINKLLQVISSSFSSSIQAYTRLRR